MAVLTRLLGKSFAHIKENIDGLVQMVASKSGRRAACPGPDAALDIPIRIAIDLRDTLGDIIVTLDGERIAIDTSGFAEVALAPDIVHIFVAQGNRAGTIVSGTLACTITADAANKPLAMTLV